MEETMERLTKKIGEHLVFPSELVGVCLTPDNEAMCEILARLAAYEDTGLEPEEIEDVVEMFHSYRHICAGLDPDRLRELAQAEKDGRLVVLPCGEGDELIKNGLTFKADHWNVLLTAFADDASTPSGKRVKLFYPEEAEAALKKREEENETD